MNSKSFHHISILLDACLDALCIRPDGVYLDATLGGAGHSLALAGRLGFSRGQTMACGDASNDIAMLRAAGLGVAMGNATPEAVAAADVQTDTNNNDGVAKAIRRWVLGEEV